MLNTFKNEIKMMFTGGRLNRKRYIAYQGFLYTCIGIISIIFVLSMPYFKNSSIPLAPLYIVRLSLVIFTVVLSLFWLSRRMNDIGKSSKWIWKLIPIGFLFLFVPSIFKVIIPARLYALENIDNIIRMIVALMYVLGGLFTFGIAGFMSFVMIFASGDHADNKFGVPPPKNNLFTSIFSVLFIIYLVLGVFSSVVEKSAELKEDQKPSVERNMENIS